MINVIQNIDSRNLISILPKDNLVQTTITSPPYFDMKDYGVENQIGFGQSYENYLNDLQSVFKQVLQRTKDDGTLWIVIDAFKREGSIVPLPFDLANKLKEIGWHFQDVIIWKKDKTVPWSTNGFVQKKIEYILFFSKQKKYKYNKDVIRVYDTQHLKQWWIKYPERYNPKGKVLDQVWEFPIPVQGSWGNEYVRHFCPLPQKMVATMILLTTNENDIVLDPFAGSGAVIAQSAYMKRKFIGAELNPQYVKHANEYLEKTLHDGLYEYENSILHSNQDEFENVIWNLRALKYGRVLLKNIETRTKFNLRLIVKLLEQTEDKLHVEYTFITELQNIDVCDNFVREIIANPPLTKFGIIPHVEYTESDDNLEDLCAYSLTNTSKYLSNKEISKAKIYSKIKVNIEEKKYEK